MRPQCRQATAGVLTAALSVGITTAGMAQGELVPPRVLEQPQPGLVANAVDKPVEGWAIVRYSVLADGAPANIRVIGIAPPAAAESAAIDAVEQWRFKPGSRDGAAIDWHNNESIVAFRGSAASEQPSEAFQAAYRDIFERLRELELPEIGEVPNEELAASIMHSLEGLRDENNRLLNEISASVRDLGAALSQAMFIDMSLSDRHRAYNWVRLATDERIDSLLPEDLFAALVMRLELEIQLGRTHDALATHARLAAGYGPDETDPAAEAAAALTARWENEEILAVLGFVGNRPWRIDAGRRIFTIDDIQGELESIEADCDTRRLTLEFQPQVEWQLPETLGECVLFVYGAPGTNFRFFEMLPAGE